MWVFKWLFLLFIGFVHALIFLSYLADYDQFLLELVRNYIGR